MLPFADQGDHVLANALACQPGEPQGCEPETTEHPVRRMVVTKTSDADRGHPPGRHRDLHGDRCENVGTGDYTAAEPAQVMDDLTGVLDDADYNGDATADLGDDPTYTEPRVAWEGELVCRRDGDHHLHRHPHGWRRRRGPQRGLGSRTRATRRVRRPDCDDPGTTVPCDGERYDLPRLSIVKSADRTELPAVGETMTYTVVVTNEGPGDYTGAEPATFTDDLSEVLDDATFVGGSITADVGSASFADPELSWSGCSPRVRTPRSPTRSATPATETGRSTTRPACRRTQALDAATACITVSVPGSGLEQAKSSDPADGSTVGVGEEITYTLTFTNTGPAAATVDTTDDLSGVLDDADLVGAPTAQNGLTVTRTGDVLEIKGTRADERGADRDLHRAGQGDGRPGRPRAGERARLPARRPARL